jgi:hypothetical protein
MSNWEKIPWPNGSRRILLNTAKKRSKNLESIEMSIFPKRTIAGQPVTIHWNLSVPAGLQRPLTPFVRIGVIDPAGQITMLFEAHVLILPSTGMPAPIALQQENKSLYLNKHTPLLLLASYLSSGPKREKLIDILNNIQCGRHYYFTWSAPADAQPGKYKLLSEVHIDGAIQYSDTAAEDFFYVEKITAADNEGMITLTNHSPEPVAVKLIHYEAADHGQPSNIQVFEIPGSGIHQLKQEGQPVFLVYNEERIIIPLHAIAHKRCVRNQQYLSLHKQEAGEEITYVLPREGEKGFRLTGMQRQLWNAADGMNTNVQLRKSDNSAVYDEMIAHGLIEEIV